MRKRLGQFAVAVLLVGVVSCGGGSGDINEREMDNFRIAPQPVLAKIEKKLADRAATGKILEDLIGDDSYRFDWVQFWEELSHRPYAKELYEQHKDSFTRLHIAHCEYF